MYDNEKTPQWNSTILENSMKALVELDKPYKYALNCCLLQKGLDINAHQAVSCFWQPDKDVSCVVSWENENISCHLTVFALAT